MRKKSFLVCIVIATFFCLTFSLVSLAQWPSYGNTGWFSQPFLSAPFLSFNPIYNYPYNNNPFPFYNSYNTPFSIYNSFLTPASPSSSGPWYNTSINYANFYNQSWFDNSAYSSRFYTIGYSNFQPPPLGTPGYTNWLSSDYNAQYPWRYGFGPPINSPYKSPETKSPSVVIINTEGLLESRIRKAIGLGPTEAITQEKASTLSSLSAGGMCQGGLGGGQGGSPYTEIKCKPPLDISLLAELTNLTELDLSHNDISDISPLAGLTNLTKLNLGDTKISDLTPLADLIKLTELKIRFAQISDISPLEGLINLTELNLTGNKISDISPLEGLTNLTVLTLHSNNISDISPLGGLTNLTELDLSLNKISDISPLEGLTNLTVIKLNENKISDISPLEGLTNLKRLVLRINELDNGDCPVINTLISKGVDVSCGYSGPKCQ